MSDPIYRANAGEAIVAEQFNAMQSRLRDFINSHTHDGSPDQGPSRLTLTELTATDKLTVGGTLLLSGSKTDVGDALTRKLDLTGGTLTGDLLIGTAAEPKALTVSGPVVVNSSLTLNATDFTLNGGSERSKYGTGQISTSAHRALVHDKGDKLTINYAGDYKGGVAVGGNLAVSGKLTVGATDVGEALARKLDRTSLVSGTVASGGSAGPGYVATRSAQGLYDITFTPPFSTAPTVVVTQIHPGDVNGGGGDTKDNAVIVGITANRVRIKTGDQYGHSDDRAFCFIAIGVS